MAPVKALFYAQKCAFYAGFLLVCEKSTIFAPEIFIVHFRNTDLYFIFIEVTFIKT